MDHLKSKIRNVPDFPKAIGPVHPEPKIYQPLWTYRSREEVLFEPLDLVVRVRGDDPARFGVRLRQIAAAVDPTLRFDELSTFAEAERRAQAQMVMFVGGIGVISVSVLLLSLAGLYALMSFTVVRQRRNDGAIGVSVFGTNRSACSRSIEDGRCASDITM